MSLLSLPDPRLLQTLAGILALLAVATLAAAWFARRRPGATAEEVRLRVRTWWGIVLALSAVLLLGPLAVHLFFAAVSLLAWREYVRLWPHPPPRIVRLVCAAAVLLHYGWLLLSGAAPFLLFIPVVMPIALAVLLAGSAPRGARPAMLVRLQWGLLVTAFGLSHVPLLAKVAATPGAGLCLVLYLVMLTELNDIAQFLWGRGIGGLKLVPCISPNKTWSGLLGGLATTFVLALLLAPQLTPLTSSQAAVAGLIIGAGGALGDLAMSAIKRVAGVGASGSALPGHGGLLDRLDSLTFTAPLFLHTVTAWLTGP